MRTQKNHFIRMLPTMQVLALACAFIFVGAVVATGGCSSSSTPSVQNSPTPAPSFTLGPSPSPTASPSPTPTAVNFVILAYSSIKPTIDPTFGEIQGFGTASAAPSATPLPKVVSQVVTVHCNQTIQFFNLDGSLFHTASLLGPSSGSAWPPWNNVNGASTATPQFTGGQLTPITYPQFSTGTMLARGTAASLSAVYSTGPSAGTFYFGDYYEYAQSPPMRTVIDILCP